MFFLSIQQPLGEDVMSNRIEISPKFKPGQKVGVLLEIGQVLCAVSPTDNYDGPIYVLQTPKGMEAIPENELLKIST